jgi:hypothetical protein
MRVGFAAREVISHPLLLTAYSIGARLQAAMRNKRQAEMLTASEPLSITLDDGSVIDGTLWFHPSRRGQFKVSHGGISKTNGRSYMTLQHMRAVARIILREMTGGQ